MKPQTCCCHICKTSLNQYKREFLPCTRCNKIVCRNCFGTKYKASTWDESSRRRSSWLCPSCTGTCTCSRCRKIPKSPPLKFSSGSEEFKREIERDFRRSPSPSPIPSPTIPGSPRGSSYVTSHEMTPTHFSTEQIREIYQREQRCDRSIREMERLLQIVKKEKRELAEERARLEREVNHNSPEAPRHAIAETLFDNPWGQLLISSERTLMCEDPEHNDDWEGEQMISASV
eukprot:TRINITY_DN1589_c0_g1_i2.p1 TRINITY_DN1589_c0_g1~~TRINITY_DN1589_c0_g1_i2.p1  ORF type:complete len:231 (-),score=30.87 TRINITY_DN1589_c0_g1_i2:103-795(-)